MNPDTREFLTFVSGFIVAAMLALMATAARGEESLRLRASPSVAAETIMLGDIFHGVTQDIEVGAAPAPGRQVTFDPAWLSRLAARHGLVWTPDRDTLRVVVARETESVEGEALARYLAEELTARDGREWQVQLAFGQALHAEMGAPRDIEILSLQQASRGHGFTAELRYGPGAPVTQVRGTAMPVVELPVLTEAVPAGTVIEDSMVTWMPVAEARVPRDAVADATALIGSQARRALRPQTPVRQLDVQAPVLIEKGAVVLVVFESGPLKLSTRARALTDAAEGDTVRLINVQSHRPIEAVALREGVALALNNSAMMLGAS